MTKFDDFINPKQEVSSEHEELFGNYGCQLCDKQTDKAYFDNRTGEMFWVCSDGHRSTVQVG